MNTESPFYKEAVAVREELFFKEMKNSRDLINDEFELNGIHLVCLDQGKVIGTGRLNIVEDEAIISQMAIKENYQRQGVGAEILKELIRYCKREGVFYLKLSARETAIAFYKKFNFRILGDKYPSLKTGVVHQKMTLKID
ncbi:GNAT family N-acetyltransferase [Cognatitamlana onchidii]|uniref:GNAT family N-acetyltransferase n=1 Tax=Cognatitamlana onchidii TaxID=2562860 RepID=UPI0010A5C93C|nr:GNAT family N-acetyltransferase [Algibacter onchidii]